MLEHGDETENEPNFIAILGNQADDSGWIMNNNIKSAKTL